MPWTHNQSANRFDRWSHSSVSATAANSTDVLDVGSYDIITIQSVHAAHADTSTVTIQSTIDGTNWDNIAGATILSAGAAGSGTIVINPVLFRQIRITVTETDAAGNVTINLIGRKMV